MDYFDTLLGGNTRDPERMKEVARQLRRQQAYGTLGMMTGDPVLGQIGAGMVEQTGTRTQRLRKARQAAATMDFRRTEADRDARQAAAMMDFRRAEADRDARQAEDLLSFRKAEAERKARQAASTARALGGCSYEQGGEIKEIPGCREAQDRAFETKVLLQTLKNRGKGKDDYHRAPKWVVDQATAQASALDEIGRIQGEFKDNYTQTLGAGPQSRIPNIAARYGATMPGVPQTKEAQQWWAKYRRLVTLPERNKLFGATLSDKEKASWDEVDLNPSMDPQQIRNGMQTLLELASRAATRSRGTFTAEGYRPGTMEAIYGEQDSGSTGGGSWDSPEAVREAFRNGDLTQEQASTILQNDFGFE